MEAGTSNEAKLWLKPLLSWLSTEIVNLEDTLYSKVSRGHFNNLSMSDLNNYKVAKRQIVKLISSFMGELKTIFGKVSIGLVSTEDKFRLQALDGILEKTNYSLSCGLFITQLSCVQLHNEIRRQRLDISNREKYIESVKRELLLLQEDESFINFIITLSLHDCPIDFYTEQKKLKLHPGCESHFCPNFANLMRRDRKTRKQRAIFKIRNSILKQHCKLPFTAAINSHCRVYPDHEKLLLDDVTGRPVGPDTVTVIVLMFHPKTLIEHALYVRISTKYRDDLTYDSFLEHVRKQVNRYYRKYKIEDNQKPLHAIKLSRYNLQLIDEEEPVFENGEILWVNHVQYEIVNHRCIDCECYSANPSPWFVLSHQYHRLAEIVDINLCWCCFKEKGTPCERCGEDSYCSVNCYNFNWVVHNQRCKTKEKLVKTDEELHQGAVQIIQQVEPFLFEASVALEDKIVSGKVERTLETIVRHYTDIANAVYDNLVIHERIYLESKFSRAFTIVDPYRLYDPVCLLIRLTRMFIRYHVETNGKRVVSQNSDGKYVVTLCNDEFTNQEAKLLAHNCVNNSKLQTFPEKYDARFKTSMFDVNRDRALLLPIHFPFTNLDPKYKRIGYDFGTSKCDKIDEEFASEIDNPLVKGKLIWILLLNSEKAIESRYSIFFEWKDSYSLRELEETALDLVKKRHPNYLQVRLSRFNLELIGGDRISIDDGEVLLINHAKYHSELLGGEIWRVLIHDTKLDLADPKLCSWCYTKIGKDCSSCKKIRYCSSECQMVHWPVHKFNCSNGNELCRQAAEKVPDIFEWLQRQLFPSKLSIDGGIEIIF